MCVDIRYVQVFTYYIIELHLKSQFFTVLLLSTCQYHLIFDNHNNTNTRWSDHIFIFNVDFIMKINTIYMMGQIILIQKLPGELLMAFIAASSPLPA